MHRSSRPQRALGLALAAVLVVGGGVTVHLATANGAERAPAAPEQPSVIDTTARDRAVASRTNERTRGLRVVPAPTTQDAACRLDLGYGTWAIDVVAARTLTMLTAVAYRDGKSYVKAARAFERQLYIKDRTPLTPIRAKSELVRKRKNPVPRITSLDAVHAMFRPHTLFCATPLRAMPAQPMLSNGLTPRALSMVRGWAAAYGGRPLGGFSSTPITSGHIENSAHYDGRAVDIFFPLSDPDNNARGWMLSHWLVAHADWHQLSTIIFDDMVWTRLKSGEGWRPYVHPYGPTENVTLRHLDHIHVDVVQGS